MRLNTDIPSPWVIEEEKKQEIQQEIRLPVFEIPLEEILPKQEERVVIIEL